MYPGWIWPVNIALQEIILISLFFCEIIFFGFKNSKINFILFLILVIIRDSGKATLLALLIFYFLQLNFNIDSKNKVNYLFKSLWILHFLFIISTFVFIDFVEDLDKSSLIRYFLIKRFVYIQESVYFLFDPIFLFLGGGFGPENYFSAAKNLSVLNAPQLLPLTILVFGGVFFYLLYVFLSLKLFDFFSRNNILEFYVRSFIFSIAIIMTFHEYFVNPFVYLSVGLVLISYKSVNEDYGF